MYSEITVCVSPSCEHLETSWIHQAINSTGNSFTVCVVGRDARTREAMRVFGTSVGSNICAAKENHAIILRVIVLSGY
jgi:hypothetical protein